MAAIKAEADAALKSANLPFSAEQERAIVLIMEDRRKASEDLFGDLFDFRGGPTQGQDADRLRSAIEWMRNEFQTRLRDVLTPEQRTVWDRNRNAAATPAPGARGQRSATARQQSQTQYVRINNNSFTAEDATFRFEIGRAHV